MILERLKQELEIPYPSIWNALGVPHGSIRGFVEGDILWYENADNNLGIKLHADGQVSVEGKIRGRQVGFGCKATKSAIVTSLEAALPGTETHYLVVSKNGIETFRSREALLARYTATGESTGPNYRHLKPELQGQPVIDGLCGPMWGDRKGDVVTVRYEDWETYNLLSR
jgi:hypothetical protein